MVQVFRFYSKVLPIFSDVFQLFVPAHGLPHIKRVLSCFQTCRVVVIIIYYPAKDTVSVDGTPLATFPGSRTDWRVSIP